jgi:hypothetical protein
MFVLGNSEDLLLSQAAQADAIFQCDHGPSPARFWAFLAIVSPTRPVPLIQVKVKISGAIHSACY